MKFYKVVTTDNKADAQGFLKENLKLDRHSFMITQRIAGIFVYEIYTPKHTQIKTKQEVK